MTNHDDLPDVEIRLRSTLRERSGDVETTPALYDRVQHQAARGARLRRGVAVAAATAVAAGAFAIVPGLLPDEPLQPDVLDTPEDATPPTDPTPQDDPAPTSAVPAALLDAGVVFADGDGGLTVGGRTITSPAPVVSVAVSPNWDAPTGYVAAALDDGTVGVVDQRAPTTGSTFDLLLDADANGGGLGFTPDGAAVAWLDGRQLHVMPLESAPAGERVLPLEGEVPDDLVLEQWFGAADAQLLLASDPAGGIWRIPMDDSNAFNTAPTGPASLLPAAADVDVVDAALLSDLSLAVLRVPSQGVATLHLNGLPMEVPDVRSRGAQLEVTGASFTLFDRTTGVGSRRDVTSDSIDLVAAWEARGIVAVAPLGPVAPAE